MLMDFTPPESQLNSGVRLFDWCPVPLRRIPGARVLITAYDRDR
jgi:hypothetical protein